MKESEYSRFFGLLPWVASRRCKSIEFLMSFPRLPDTTTQPTQGTPAPHSLGYFVYLTLTTSRITPMLRLTS